MSKHLIGMCTMVALVSIMSTGCCGGASDFPTPGKFSHRAPVPTPVPIPTPPVPDPDIEFIPTSGPVPVSNSNVTSDIEPDPIEASFHIAIFRYGRLVECSSVSTTEQIQKGTSPTELIKRRANLDRLFKKIRTTLTSGTRPAGETTRVLTRPCYEHYADRPTLAYCNVGNLDIETGRRTSLYSIHYDFREVFVNGPGRRGCEDVGGAWSEVSEDSKVYRNAENRYTRVRNLAH